MIPSKLAIRNFMCYRDSVPPLYFDGIHLACLSGDNGNGKSALIDAMTWALWGQARAKSDDDLIHSGQMEMEVEFDFTVGQQLYRIIRKRSRPKRNKGAGQSILELQTATGDGFRSITGNSIAQTQQKLIDILHMDYPTFVNSAFLRQGHADEFTIKRPAERKEVLADILGLSLYDELERQARELSRDQGDEKTQLEHSITEISEELARKPGYVTELEQATSELDRIEGVFKEKDSGLNELRDKKQALEQKKEQLEQVEKHSGNTTSNLAQWENQIKQYQTRIKGYEELINQRTVIKDGHARFTETKRLVEELNQKLGIQAKLNERKSQLIRVIDKGQSELTTSHTIVQNKIAELEARSQELPNLWNQLNQAQTQLQQLAEPEELLRQKKQTVQELQNQVTSLESNKARLEGEIKEIQEKLSLLADQTKTTCPLCETELGLEGLKLIESKYTKEGQSKSAALESNLTELSQKKMELESSTGEISQLEARLNQEKTAAQNNASVLINRITDAEAAAKQLAEERKRLGEIEQQLARKDFATVEQGALKELEDELAHLGYNSEHHEQTRNRLKGLEQYDPLKRKLDEAESLINQEREATARAEETVQGLRRNLEADNLKKQSLTEELTSLPRVINDLAKAEAEHQALARQRNQSLETVGSVKARLQRLAELEIRKKEKEGLIAQVSKQENIYKELAKAFGKGGVQALIIETALPEIEVEANRLLARMTDNRMHVKFETQRATKKGDVIETLDINISDELGTRNYEMFSGGEAFRINFAVRIALSKLLAKRAGAPLPTLIIDEGFGTQDSTGIEKLKEAINSIQDDFEKILVITHIEELRDAFPTRIDVIKTAEGSTISVN